MMLLKRFCKCSQSIMPIINKGTEKLHKISEAYHKVSEAKIQVESKYG